MLNKARPLLSTLTANPLSVFLIDIKIKIKSSQCFFDNPAIQIKIEILNIFTYSRSKKSCTNDSSIELKVL
jgi:hypothetical protein